MVLKATCTVKEQTLQGTNYTETVAKVAADSNRRGAMYGVLMSTEGRGYLWGADVYNRWVMCEVLMSTEGGLCVRC